MNPIVKDGLKIVWKVENVDSLDANGKYSPELVTDNFKWKLAVQTKEINKIKYLALYFYSGNEKIKLVGRSEPCIQSLR
ncbi:unnamed protein product [Caenorhabditis angaria]|uniref:MATH domain-containing protein n=1 Tax=Caenorhabditis angaria TaxID=860376 RepID=A0A9P1IG42_9PELO|nr:unnamed protein product [Caenorhabditis angaria]